MLLPLIRSHCCYTWLLTHAVSVAIMVERKEAGKEYPVQRTVYYISEVLIESKQRYPHWQKLVYGVFMASRKLKQYFWVTQSRWLVLLP